MAGEIPSRLGSRAGGPARGLGSGYVENQRISGAADPEAAARMARMDPEVYQQAVEKQEADLRQVEERRGALIDAIESGKWTPSAKLPPNTTWRVLLSQQSPDIINDWHARLVQDQEQDIESTVQNEIRDQFAVEIDHPLYQPMTDTKRRAEIEAKLQPMDFESMLFKGYAEQKIQLRPGLEITLRTVATKHGQWIEFALAKIPDTSDQALRHTLSLMQLAVSLEALNDTPCAPSIDRLVKDADREQFTAALALRMDRLGGWPEPLTNDLIVQFIWFNGRVRKLLSNSVEKVGNS